MKHFGIFITDLESERFLSASNDQIATWLFLHAFCSKQTNGGTIDDAASLPDRFWNRHGIDKGTLDQASPLWSWAGDSLSVEPYDIHGETLYLKKSKGGKEGNAIRWKDRENKSLDRTPIRTPIPPDPTRPDPTRPDPTRPKKRSAPAFEKPTLEMVHHYGATLDPPFTNGNDFLDYYDSNGWRVGSSAMKDWKATVRRWNRNRQTTTGNPSKAAGTTTHRTTKAASEYDEETYIPRLK